ncbi:MAG: DNRLRE domain-containing protein [Phycisphaerales bacterium]
MRFPRPFDVASMTFCALFASPAAAQTVVLSPVADATLYESSNGSIANGTGQSMFAGLTLRGAGFRRALLRFDFSSIPAGSVITGAELTLEVTRSNSAPCDVTLHRVLASWGEGPSFASEPGGLGNDALPGDTTWLHRFYPTVFWSAVGGDFVPGASASAVADGLGAVVWTATPGMLADLNAWHSSPATNFGWLLQSFSADSNSARRFGSRESSIPADRPRLELTYAPFCEVCRADVNCDGAVDGDDVIAFFTPWDNGLAEGDFNNDGSIDGDDVIGFFARWDAGC